MAELAASIITLVATAKAVSGAFTLLAAVRDCPKEIENLRKEHDSLASAIESVRSLVQSGDDVRNVSSTFVEQVHTVIGDTKKTLDELQAAVKTLQPNKDNCGKIAALQMRWKYFFKESALQAIMARIRARREALSLMVNVWSSADAQEMRRQLDGIRTSLESCLNSIRVPPATASGPESLASPMSVSSEANEWSDGSSEFSRGNRAETATSMSEVLEDEPALPSFNANFDRALARGRNSGPRGEAIRRRIAQLNAVNSSSIGAAISKKAQPTSPVAASAKGKSPATEKIRTLAQTLSSREVNTPGIWSKEGATAAQALARVYQEAEDFESAFEYYYLALIAREVLLGPNHLTTITTLDLIAGVLEFLSRWDVAFDYYQLSLDRRASNPNIGTTHPTYLPIAVRIGRMYSRKGDFEMALQQYASVLEQYRTMPGGGGEAAMAVRADVAKVRLQFGDFAQACHEAEESIAEYERLLQKRTSNPLFHPGHKLVVEAQNTLQSVKDALEAARNAQELSPYNNTNPTGESDPVPAPVREDTAESKRFSSSVPASWAPEIEAYEAKLIEAQKANGNLHPKTLELMCSLAGAYTSHEQYEAAISWFLEALQGQKTTFGETHPTTLGTLHNLGVCHASTKNNASALKFLQEAVTGRRSRLPQNHPDTVTSIVQLAIVFQALKEFQQALQLIQEAVVSYTARFGAKHPKTLSAEARRARILYEKGDLTAAQMAHESVLRDREALNPQSPNHPQVLASKSQLGLVYRDQKDYDRAIAMLESAHQGQRSIFGPLNSITMATALDLASIYWDTKNWQKTLDYYLLVLRGIRNERAAGPTAGTVMMHNIAMCYVQLEKHEEALSWFTKVFKLYETEFGKDHEKTIGALGQVAHQCFAMEKFDEAIGHYSRVLTVKEKVLPDSDETIMLVLFQLFRCTLNSGQNEKSLAWGQRFVAIGEVTELERRLAVKRGIGLIHSRQKRYTEALELFNEVLSDSEFLPKDHWLLSSIANDIQRVYHEWDVDISAVDDLSKQRERVQYLLTTNPKAGSSILCELGYIHARQHMHHEALSLLEEALETIQCLDPDTEATDIKLRTISGIANAHIELYNNSAAIIYLNILIETPDNDDWKLSGLIRMATALEKDGQFENAIEVWKRVFNEEKRMAGFGSLNLLCTERKIGALLLRVGRTDEAMRWVDNALIGLRCCTDPEAEVQTMSTLSLQSAIYLERGDLEHGLNAQLQCATGLEATVGSADRKFLDASLDLADLYNTLGREREALEWYEKAIAGYGSKLSDCDVRVLNAEQCRRELRKRAMEGEI